MKQLLKYFISGLLFLVPFGVCVYVVYLIFFWVDSLVRKPLESTLGWWVSGLGVVISLAVIIAVGALSSMFITRPFMQFIERMIGRLPLIKLLYQSIKDLIGAFVGDKKKFDKPVLITLIPGGGAKIMGFITAESLEFLSLKDKVAVYCPQSYNFAGMTIVVGRDQITPLEADSSEVMAFIVSGGVSGRNKKSSGSPPA
jgi:uncharacterized membrane protein